ncbi:MAG: hypothetical protein AMS15_09095 [Planctomycetes bacterium DG_23]|nr:MAG: hypothetical protein AMS15_09095 [Planctomycetes bacterium DG_23]
MAEEALIELIIHGREERNLEYKGSLSWKYNTTRAEAAKTCMGMANIPDGGAIVFGVKEMSRNQYEPIGMKSSHFESFNQDDVSDYVNGYADPYVELKVSKVPHDGKKFVIIQVQEFSELPVICKKNGPEGLKKGAIFTRPRRKNETVAVPSQTEMREILDSAVDKRVRKNREQLFRWGLIRPAAPEDIDVQKFEEQLRNL